jgi:pentatricopeptide repeat protein
VVKAVNLLATPGINPGPNSQFRPAPMDNTATAIDTAKNTATVIRHDKFSAGQITGTINSQPGSGNAAILNESVSASLNESVNTDAAQRDSNASQHTSQHTPYYIWKEVLSALKAKKETNETLRIVEECIFPEIERERQMQREMRVMMQEVNEEEVNVNEGVNEEGEKGSKNEAKCGEGVIVEEGNAVNRTGSEQNLKLTNDGGSSERLATDIQETQRRWLPVFNLAMDVLAESGSSEEAFQLLHTMEPRYGIPPSGCT